MWDDDKIPSHNDLAAYFSKINKKLHNIAKITTKSSIVSLSTKTPINCDFKNFEQSVEKFEKTNKIIFAKEAFKIYSGEFLPGIISNWALTARLYFEELFFEIGKRLILVEDGKLKRLSYLKKMVNFGIKFETLIEILNENQRDYYIDKRLFDYLLLKNKMLRNPEFIPILITFDNDFPLEDNIRKGDIVLKISNNTFKVLIEQNPKFDINENIKQFCKRLNSLGAKIKNIKKL